MRAASGFMVSKSVFSPAKIFRWLARLALSGPLITCLGLGIGFLCAPAESFGPGHKAILDLAKPEVWGVACITSFVVGHWGRLRNNQKLWLRAHAISTMILWLFGSCFLFTVWANNIGSWPISLGITGLALHSLSRSSGFYRAPFQCDERKM